MSGVVYFLHLVLTDQEFLLLTSTGLNPFVEIKAVKQEGGKKKRFIMKHCKINSISQLN